MMTNGGELTWAVEFRPTQLVGALQRQGCIVAEIATKRSRVPATEPPAIGIVTGNGPDSGMTLWTLLNGEIRERLSHQFPRRPLLPPCLRALVAGHGDSPWSWTAVRSSSGRCSPRRSSFFAVRGAAHLVLACNTTQDSVCVSPKSRPGMPPNSVLMADCTVRHLAATGVDEIAMIGIRYVADLGEWSAYRDLARLRVEPVPPRFLSASTSWLYRVKPRRAEHRGPPTVRRHLASRHPLQYVVVALTELSLLLAGQASGRLEKVMVDTLGLYAGAIAGLGCGACGSARNPRCSRQADPSRDRPCAANLGARRSYYPDTTRIPRMHTRASYANRCRTHMSDRIRCRTTPRESGINPIHQ